MISSHLIREARLRSGLTQAELARRLGTTQSAMARWEAGGTHPPLETVRDLVRACALELEFRLADGPFAERSLIDAALALTPEQRLDQLVRTVRFVQRGRQAVAGRRG